jgi:hypothetical protein
LRRQRHRPGLCRKWRLRRRRGKRQFRGKLEQWLRWNLRRYDRFERRKRRGYSRRRRLLGRNRWRRGWRWWGRRCRSRRRRTLRWCNLRRRADLLWTATMRLLHCGRIGRVLRLHMLDLHRGRRLQVRGAKCRRTTRRSPSMQPNIKRWTAVSRAGLGCMWVRRSGRQSGGTGDAVLPRGSRSAQFDAGLR